MSTVPDTFSVQLTRYQCVELAALVRKAIVRATDARTLATTAMQRQNHNRRIQMLGATLVDLEPPQKEIT